VAALDAECDVARQMQTGQTGLLIEPDAVDALVGAIHW